MKKILSIMLCAVMLIGAMSMLAFADEDLAYIDARDLREYGQKHYYVGAADETAPEIDGSVVPGEYTLVVETTLDEGYIGPEFSSADGDFRVDGQVSAVNYYFSYDANYLYVAAEVYDEEYITYGTWESLEARCDQVGFTLGGFEDTGSPETLMSKFQFVLYASNPGELADIRCVDEDKNSMGYWVGQEGLMDQTALVENYEIKYDETRKVITYEIAFKRAAFKELWTDSSAWDLRDDIFSLSFFVNDVVSELQEGKDYGARAGLWNWGTPVDPDNSPYGLLTDYWFSNSDVYTNASQMGTGGQLMIPNMLFLGYEEDFVDVLSGANYEVDTGDEETEPTETEPTETEPTETEPTETEPTETEPTETEATGTDKPDDDAKEGGCGSSIAAMGIALVATLGTAVTVVAKKKD